MAAVDEITSPGIRLYRLIHGRFVNVDLTKFTEDCASVHSRLTIFFTTRTDFRKARLCSTQFCRFPAGET